MANFFTEEFLGLPYWMWIVIIAIIIILIQYLRRRQTSQQHTSNNNDEIERQIRDCINRKTILRTALIRVTKEKIDLIKSHDKALAFVNSLMGRDVALIWSDEARQEIKEENEEISKFLDKEHEFASSLVELNKLEAEIFRKIQEWKASFASNANVFPIIEELEKIIAEKTNKKTDSGIIWLIRQCYNYNKHEAAYGASLQSALTEENLKALLKDRLETVKGNVGNLKANLGAEIPLIRLISEKLNLQIQKLNELLGNLGGDLSPESPVKPPPTIHPSWQDTTAKHDPNPPKTVIFPAKPVIPPQPKPQPTKLKKVFVDLSPWFMPIKNQNGAGACGAFAGAAIAEFLRNTDGAPIESIIHASPSKFSEDDELSELFLWYFTRAPNAKTSNEGCYLRDITNSLAEYGDCFEKFWKWLPLDINEVPVNFANPPDNESRHDASGKRITGHKVLSPNEPDSWVSELLNGNPLLIAIQVDENFAAAGRSKSLYFEKGTARLGGHFVDIVGFTTAYPSPKDPKVALPAFKIRNSWGTNWGENGYLWIAYDIIPQILIDKPVAFEKIKRETEHEQKKKKEQDNSKKGIPEIKLYNGVKMPVLGLGTWQLTGREANQAAKNAIANGYSHIDTSENYGNEEQIGKAIEESGTLRQHLFITTKIDPGNFNNPRKALLASLAKLRTNYVDLYLIHWPYTPTPLYKKWLGGGNETYIDAWKKLINLYEEGLCKSIGVSNFGIHHIEKIVGATGRIPMVNQIECHPFNTEQQLRSYCKSKNIIIEAFSPLTSGIQMKDALIRSISKKHGKSYAQIMLRWAVQSGMAVLPRSTSSEHQQENKNIFDFELDMEDMRLLNGLNRDLQVNDNAPGWRQFD